MSLPTPNEITEWLDEHYPRPKIAPEWLNECYNWIVTNHPLSVQTDLDLIIEHVEMQLLNSDLRDSTLPRTGLPMDIHTWHKRCLGKQGVLVEVAALTEIGHSAFNLFQAREKRIESEGVRGLEDEEEVPDDAGLPKYPRGMLRFELTDGFTTIPAIEYRSLPGFELGVTPLGCKMELTETLIRSGTAFLEPKTIVMKGGKNEERDQYRDADFLRGLNTQLDKPNLNVPPMGEDQDENAAANDENAPPVPVAGAARRSRAPLRELSEPPVAPTDAITDEDLPRRRKVPQPPSTSSSSHYFPPMPSSSSAAVSQLADERLLSPARRDPLVVDHGDDLSFGELDDDLYMDDEFLEELGRAERAAQSQGAHEAQQDVIVIGSDSDQDDKENVPVPQRRVRRRTGDLATPSQSRSESVIEIVSD